MVRLNACAAPTAKPKKTNASARAGKEPFPARAEDLR